MKAVKCPKCGYVGKLAGYFSDESKLNGVSTTATYCAQCGQHMQVSTSIMDVSDNFESLIPLRSGQSS